VALLPYLEQDDLFQQTFNTTATQPLADRPEPAQPLGLSLSVQRQGWWTAAGNLHLARQRLAVFRCPSDKETLPASVLYATHVSHGRFAEFPGPGFLAWTNYTGVAGAAGDFANPALPWSQWEGMLTNRGALTLKQVSNHDGSSNTLLFGEGLGGSGVGERDRAWSWFGVGAMGTAYGLGRPDRPAPAEPPPLGAQPANGQDGAQWYRFSSRHPGTVQFAFGDCSVRGLIFGSTTTPNLTAGGDPPRQGNNLSAWAILQQMAGWKDGFSNDISGSVD
jgi:prepilin-type processing-associated H-X9-DG protein